MITLKFQIYTKYRDQQRLILAIQEPIEKSKLTLLDIYNFMNYIELKEGFPRKFDWVCTLYAQLKGSEEDISLGRMRYYKGFKILKFWGAVDNWVLDALDSDIDAAQGATFPRPSSRPVHIGDLMFKHHLTVDMEL